MAIHLGDLAEKLGAILASGSRDGLIEGVASLKDAKSGELAPFTDERFAVDLKRTQAGAVLAKESVLDGLPAGVALLCCADPEMAFLKATHLLHPEDQVCAGIDPRAVVESEVELGVGVHVGAYAVIARGARMGARSVLMPHSYVGSGAIVGEDCRIHPHVVIYAGVKLGQRVIVHSGAVLGADGFGYKFRNGRHYKVPQIGILEVGDDVEIGANTCLDRAALGATCIGDGTKIDNLVQVGHGARVGKHCILCGQSAIAGSSGMDDYAVLGGNAGIADHVFMGKGARAGAKSGVGKDVPPGTEVFGLFAEERKIAFKQLAALRRLPDLMERIRFLEKELGRRHENDSKQ